jgi:hypothetical protein
MSARLAEVQRVLSVLLHPKRFLTFLGLAVGTVLYVWLAAVRAVPGVRRRKAALREAWRRRHLERRDADRRPEEPWSG